MNTETPSARTLFLEAVENVRPEQWPQFVDSACAGDETLRQQVLRLLEAHGQVNSFMAQPAGGMAAEVAATIDQPVTERIGEEVGRYKLMEQIGEGGMGVVYVAEQTQPIRRKVALKIIKPGMDSRQVIARFEAERQALAMMDHPNIAKMHDAGTTVAGRPYFVMELVRGMPITEYCDKAQLTPRPRLELFVTVCQAVQHAHQKGIIHRDLKPSNVLVTLHDGVPVAKVIDFGVAKAMHQQLTEHTIYTAFSQMIGTPLYMSPEQAEMSGMDIDTRSDVYSLGVLLYELLTGQTPFDSDTLRKAGLDEMRRIIREDEPPRPSHRVSTLQAQALSTVSQQRGIDERRLSQVLRGELDWIVMKALEKDRTRRYESASALAADVQRHLDDEPVEACPPSASYRIRKVIRRKRKELATVVVLTLALFAAVGSIGGSVGWVLRDHKTRQALLEHEVGLALTEAQARFESGRRAEAMASVQRAEGLLASGGNTAELTTRVGDWRADLEMVARLEQIRLATATWMDDSFDYEGADSAYERAFSEYGIDLASLGIDEGAKRIRAQVIRLDLGAALDNWADARRRARKTDDRAWRQLLAVARAADPDEWRTQVRNAMERPNRETLGKLAESTKSSALPASTKCLLGATLTHRGAVMEGVAFLRQAQQQHPDDFWINFQLAQSLEALPNPRPADVVRFYSAALALRPDSPAVYNNLGRALDTWRNAADAIVAYREAIRLDPNLAIAHRNLGKALISQGQVDEGITAIREAIRVKPDYADAFVSLSDVLGRQSRLDESIAASREALRLKPDLAQAHYNLGVSLKDKGAIDEAVAAFRESIRLAPRDSAGAYNNLGNILQTQKKFEEAIEAYRAVIQFQPNHASAHNNLGNALLKNGNQVEGIAAYREAIRLKPDYAEAYYNLAVAHMSAGDTTAAIAVLEEAANLDNGMDAMACQRNYLLSLVHQQAGHADRSRACFDQAERLWETIVKTEPVTPFLHAVRQRAAEARRLSI